MPTYQYQCTECGEGLEAVQKFTDDALTVVPELRRTPEEGVLGGRHRLQGLRLLPERQPRLVVEQLAGHVVGSGVRARPRRRPRRRRARTPTAASQSASSKSELRRPSSSASGCLGRRRAVSASPRVPSRRPGSCRSSAASRVSVTGHDVDQQRPGRDRRHRRLGLLLVPGRRDRGPGGHPLRLRPATRSSSARSPAAGWPSCPATAAATTCRRTASTTAPTCGRCARSGSRQVLGPCAVGGLRAGVRARARCSYRTSWWTVRRPASRPSTTASRCPTARSRTSCTSRFADPYCPSGRRAALDAARPAAGRRWTAARWSSIEGPRFSTRAESQLARGAGLVGGRHDRSPRGDPRPRTGALLHLVDAGHRPGRGRRDRRGRLARRGPEGVRRQRRPAARRCSSTWSAALPATRTATACARTRWTAWTPGSRSVDALTGQLPVRQRISR